jgi:hypothetical protein
VILSTALVLLIGAAIHEEHQIRRAAAAQLRAAGVQLQGTSTGPLPSVPQLQAQQEILKAYAELQSAARSFWSQLAQMILLNLLLPVLTALLGYVFGSRSNGR